MDGVKLGSHVGVCVWITRGERPGGHVDIFLFCSEAERREGAFEEVAGGSVLNSK